MTFQVEGKRKVKDRAKVKKKVRTAYVCLIQIKMNVLSQNNMLTVVLHSQSIW